MDKSVLRVYAEGLGEISKAIEQEVLPIVNSRIRELERIGEETRRGIGRTLMKTNPTFEAFTLLDQKRQDASAALVTLRSIRDTLEGVIGTASPYRGNLDFLFRDGEKE